MAEHGIWVPPKLVGFNGTNHTMLQVYALNKDRSSPRKDMVLSRINGDGQQFLNGLHIDLLNDIERNYSDARDNKCEKVLWSCEGLYLLNSATEYKRLTDLFQKHSTEINVILCFRDIESFRRSIIQQFKAFGYSPSSTPDSFQYWKPDSWLFDYKLKKSLLSESFDNCLYFDYDPTDNVKRFFDTIGYNFAVGTQNFRLHTTPRKPRLLKSIINPLMAKLIIKTRLKSSLIKLVSIIK